MPTQTRDKAEYPVLVKIFVWANVILFALVWMMGVRLQSVQAQLFKLQSDMVSADRVRTFWRSSLQRHHDQTLARLTHRK
jgi:hypothetical protein